MPTERGSRALLCSSSSEQVTLSPSAGHTPTSRPSVPLPVSSLDNTSEFHYEVLSPQDAFQWLVEALSSRFVLCQLPVLPPAPSVATTIPHPTQDVAEDPFVACTVQSLDLPDDVIPDLFPDGASHEDFSSSLPARNPFARSQVSGFSL